MEYEVETIYYLENPETDQVTFATGSQLRYEDIVKNVFGVASIQDLPMMIQYNKSFQSSICKSHGVMENEVKLEMVLRVASKMDLQQLKKMNVDHQKTNQDTPLEENSSCPCPFDSVIRLQEGIFKWNDENSSYNMVTTS